MAGDGEVGKSTPQPDLESSTKAGPLQPPPPSPQNDNVDLHPVIGNMRNQELGKATLAFALSIASAYLTSDKNKVAGEEMNLILIVFSAGFVAILSGILLRETFPKPSELLEQLGIAVVSVAFNGFMAFLLPVELRWIPAVCIGFFLLPFIIASGKPRPT